MVNRNILLSVTVIAIFTLSAGVVWADEVTSAINYQGRLADSSGSPLSGTYTMTFRLYEAATGGTALDTDTDTVVVTDGLFNAHTDFDQSYFDGRALWLGTTVSPDSEMTPRQELRPVPYALSLVPGAKIIGAAQWNLNVETTHPSGGALRGEASATSGTNYGVVGASRSPDGYGGYFYNNEGGVGVYGRGGEYGGYFDGNVYVRDNVGIGTTEPRAKLHIYDTGTANFERALYAMTPNVADGSHAGTIIFGQSPATRESAHLTFVDDATAGQECMAFGMYGANDLMVLNGNGNVGIGTTSPDHKLHVLGDGSHTAVFDGQTGNGDSRVFVSKSAASDVASVIFATGGTGANQGWAEIGTTQTNDLYFKANPNAGSYTTRMFINGSTGNVGIGTTSPSPSRKLDVNGHVRVRERLIVGGSDFRLGGEDGREQGDKKQNRALVHSGDDALYINWYGDFEGGVVVHGPSFSVSGTKNFLIDHPMDPEHKELIHSTLEGPEAGVFYRGEAQLSNGEATVMLPDYFEALTRKEDRTVLLTPKFEGDEQVSMLAASEVKDGKFRVRIIDSKNPSQKFYWEVKAVRADVEILEVEKTKPPAQ